MRAPLFRGRKSWIGLLPGAAAFLLGGALNGIHESHTVVVVFFASGGFLLVIWVVAVVLWPFVQAALGHGGDLSASFRMVADDHFLEVGLKNDGLTLRSAVLNLLVPKRVGIVCRVTHKSKTVDTGTELDTPEELEPGEPSIYWSEPGLAVHGGGNSTLLYFLVGHRPGTYPVRLKIYDDTDKPRTLEIDGTFTIPPQQIDPDRRRRILERMRLDLDFDRQQIAAALGTGYYEASEESWLRLMNQPQIRAGIAWQEADAGLAGELEETFTELRRLDDVRVALASEAPRLQAEHRAEWALACVLHTLLRLRIREGIG